MCKKFLSMVLTAALLLSMAVIPAAAAEPKEFSDTKGHWAEEVIDQWSGYGVVQGYDGKFNPNASMTRGEFATAVVNLLGLTKKTNYIPFTDLNGDEWYTEALLKLFAAGIMKGDESKRSNPNARISREEAFVMVARALGIQPKENAELDSYDDAGKVSDWAMPTMAAMVESGFIKGVTDTTLQPGAKINRASVMQVLANTVTTYVTEPGEYTAPDKGFVVVKAAKGNVLISGSMDGVIIGQSSQGATVNLENAAVAGDVKVDAPEVTVNVKDSKVDGTVEVTPQASGAELNVAAGSTVENVVTKANEVAVKGEGEVKSVEVTGGDKVEVATPGTTVKVDEAAKDTTVTAGGETVKPGESSTTTGEPDGFVEPEPTPSPDTPSGGGSVTPSVPSSEVTIKETAMTSGIYGKALSDIQVGVTVNFQGAAATISGGALKYITGWTGFGGDDTSLNQGNYVVFDLEKKGGATPDDDTVVMTQYENANGTGIKKTYTYADSFKDGDCTYVWRVSSASSKLYLGIDWDGKDGKAYKEKIYTASLENVQLPQNIAGNTCTVTFDSQEGSLVTTKSVGIGTKATAPADPTKTGYTFAGWYTDKNGTQSFDFNAEIYADVTLYAKWTPITYTVKFDGNGSTGGTAPVDILATYDEDITIPGAGSLAKTGHTFAGWNTAANGTGTAYAANATGMNLANIQDGNVTLYAQWAEETPTSKPSTANAMGISTSDNLYGKTYTDMVPRDSTLGTPQTSGNTVTYTPAITMKYVGDYTGFSTDAKEQYGYYLPFAFTKPTEVADPSGNTPVLKFYGINENSDNVVKTFNYSEFDVNGNFFMVSRVMDSTKSIKFVLDWDGDETAYTPTTYTISMANATFNDAPQGEIAWDGGHTGGSGCTQAIDGGTSTITFGGKIAYYTSEQAIGNNAGNYVGVGITAPTGVTPKQGVTSAVIGGTTYTWAQLIADGQPAGAAGFHWYPKVTAAGQSFTATVTWAPGCEQTFTVKIANDATLAGKDSGIGEITCPGSLPANSMAGADLSKMTLTYQTEGKAVTATGTLTKIDDLSGFNTSDNSGYFAYLQIPVAKADAEAAQSATGNIFWWGGKHWTAEKDSDENPGFLIEGMDTDSPYIGMYCRVAAGDAATGTLGEKTIQFAADWDGDGNGYEKVEYTISFTGITLSAS